MLKNRWFVIVLFLLCFHVNAGSEVIYKKVEEKTVMEGLVYQKITVEKPAKATVHIIVCDVKNPNITLKAALANDKIGVKREFLKEMAEKNSAIAGINANYFGYKENERPEGTIRGILVIDGNFVSTVNSKDPWINAYVGIDSN
ncbi:MAG: hypothetical protein P9M03_03510, partial [Candidatus Theseobacter exili]|nr:hypothetical protein [Candidatus Theseobacter exili]